MIINTLRLWTEFCCNMIVLYTHICVQYMYVLMLMIIVVGVICVVLVFIPGGDSQNVIPKSVEKSFYG